MATDPLDPDLLKKQNRQQLIYDLVRNSSARALGESALTMGTGLASMAGTGLGVGAGMLVDALRGRKPNLEAATESIGEGAERFTYMPRSEGGQELMRGLATVTEPLEQGAQWAGQKTSDVTGSPALGAAVYTGLNVLDPEMLGPAAAKIAALRGAQSVARGAKFEPVSSAGIGGKQRGAWSPGDIADVEGDFEMRSTIEEALTKLKPQEQKAKGKQMLAVLKKYGAKEEELKWTGLNDALAGDVPVTADEIAQHLQQSGVRVEPARLGESDPLGEGAREVDPDEISQKASEYVYESGDLEYPYVVTRDGESIGTYNSQREAQQGLDEYRDELVESEREYYKENASEFLEPDELAQHVEDGTLDDWAEDMARNSVDDSISWEIDVDYDADPINYEDLHDYYVRQITDDPESYGLEGSEGSGKWAEYVIEGPGGSKGEKYGETIMQLQREGRYGRNVPIDTENTPANLDQMTPFQRARYEALKKAKTDPSTMKSAESFYYKTHFPHENPVVYTRESQWPKPPGSETEGSTRMVEELQSDWAQGGRKKGFLDPDEMRARQEKARATIGPKVDEMRTSLLDAIQQLPVEQKEAMAGRSGYMDRYDDTLTEVDKRNAVQNMLSDINERLVSGEPEESLNLVSKLGHSLYMVVSDSQTENLASKIMNSARDTLAALEGEGGSGLPTAPFVGDSKKVAQLGLQQAIIDAVRGGDQYVGLSPGYVHAPERWGSEDLSWWTPEMNPLPGQAAPAVRNVAARSGSYDKTRGEGWKQTVKALREGQQLGWNEPRMAQIDLESPEAFSQLREIVRKELGYEASQYADPEAFIDARTQKLLENMAAEGEGQYSPRSHGMAEFYDKMALSTLQKILKEAGSTGSGKGVQRFAEAPEGYGFAVGYKRDPDTGEWKAVELSDTSTAKEYQLLAANDPDNYRYEPPRMHVVEIDPELARAAKRGFKLPF